HERVKQPAMSNVRIIDGPFEKLALPQDASLDFVLIHLDYHEVPADVRPSMNRRIFGALKRGGSQGVVDHSAKQATDHKLEQTLPRMDKHLVIKDATSAAFRLEKEGKL